MTDHDDIDHEDYLLPHTWQVTDVEGDPGSSVVILSWCCDMCGKTWGTYSGVTMPNWEAGDCNAD